MFHNHLKFYIEANSPNKCNYTYFFLYKIIKKLVLYPFKKCIFLYFYKYMLIIIKSFFANVYIGKTLLQFDLKGILDWFHKV